VLASSLIAPRVLRPDRRRHLQLRGDDSEQWRVRRLVRMYVSRRRVVWCHLATVDFANGAAYKPDGTLAIPMPSRTNNRTTDAAMKPCDKKLLEKFDYSKLGPEFVRLSKPAKRALINNCICRSKNLVSWTGARCHGFAWPRSIFNSNVRGSASKCGAGFRLLSS
jgi:hypothetical protein